MFNELACNYGDQETWSTILTLVAEAILSRADENLKEIPQFTEVVALEQNQKKYSNCLNSEMYINIL